jgi:hypothetical protein
MTEIEESLKNDLSEIKQLLAIQIWINDRHKLNKKEKEFIKQVLVDFQGGARY